MAGGGWYVVGDWNRRFKFDPLEVSYIEDLNINNLSPPMMFFKWTIPFRHAPIRDVLFARRLKFK